MLLRMRRDIRCACLCFADSPLRSVSLITIACFPVYSLYMRYLLRMETRIQFFAGLHPNDIYNVLPRLRAQAYCLILDCKDNQDWSQLFFVLSRAVVTYNYNFVVVIDGMEFYYCSSRWGKWCLWHSSVYRVRPLEVLKIELVPHLKVLKLLMRGLCCVTCMRSYALQQAYQLNGQFSGSSSSFILVATWNSSYATALVRGFGFQKPTWIHLVHAEHQCYPVVSKYALSRRTRGTSWAFCIIKVYIEVKIFVCINSQKIRWSHGQRSGQGVVV